jgi:addiction module HigA family antidote
MKPVERCHPSECIREEIEARGWTLEAFADAAGIGLPLASEIVNGKRRMTRMVALCVGRAFGTGESLWRNLQAAYDEGAR